MSTPFEHTKITTDQAELNRLFDEIGGEESFHDCEQIRVRDESFGWSQPTIRKELIENKREGELVAIWFRYTRRDGTVRISPKMLLLAGIRHCC